MKFVLMEFLQFFPAADSSLIPRERARAADPRGPEQHHSGPGDETGAIFNIVVGRKENSVTQV